MIKPKGEMETEFRERMRGGNGKVQITHIFNQGDFGGKCRLFAKVTLGPGCSIGRHEHQNEEEIFYIVKGRGLVDDDGTQTAVHPGDAVLTGGGRFHAIENTGSESLEMVAVILLY